MTLEEVRLQGFFGTLSGDSMAEACKKLYINKRLSVARRVRLPTWQGLIKP
jgi:hypothetical protein